MAKNYHNPRALSTPGYNNPTMSRLVGEESPTVRRWDCWYVVPDRPRTMQLHRRTRERGHRRHGEIMAVGPWRPCRARSKLPQTKKEVKPLPLLSFY